MATGFNAAGLAELVMREELEAMREHILQNHIAAGQMVTGKTGGSMQVEIIPGGGSTTGIISGASYFATLETGSEPWRNIHTRKRRDGSEYPSAPKWFIDVIGQWIRDKGLNIQNPWAVATKIMTSGSGLYRAGGRTDIFSSEIDPGVRRIADRLAGLFDVQLVNSIKNE